MSPLSSLLRQSLAGLRVLVAATLLLGVAYPLVVLGVGRVVAPWQASGSLVTAAGQISAARDTLDGTANTGLLNQGGSRDQGIAATTVNGQLQSNIVPTDSNGIAFVRSPQQVLNIVYLNANPSMTSGGFFPAGVNGAIKTSAAN